MIAGEGGGREASGDVKQSMLNEEEEGKIAMGRKWYMKGSRKGKKIVYNR